MASLEYLLKNKSNNYNNLSKLFKKKTRLSLINGGNKNISLTKSCSVIIPFYDRNHLAFKKTLTSLQYQNLQNNSRVEIIIVNDGSSINLKRVIQKTKGDYPITYLELKKNYGRATARNLALLYAKNEIIIFLDADTVVPANFLANHLLRHQILKKCIIVGFRYNIDFKDSILKLDNIKRGISKSPTHKNDFRYKRFIPRDWKNIYKDVPEDHFNKTSYILKETNDFKNFGQEKIFGVWKLPFMFLTCNTSVARKHILEVGGFDMRFRSWGMEDVHLGAKLIANGLYLIPNLDITVYHLIKNGSVKNKVKMGDFKRNVKLYRKLKKEKLLLFNEGDWKSKMGKYFKNKFKVNYF